MTVPASVLFLGKKDDASCQAALDHTKATFEAVEAFTGEWGEPLPDAAKNWRGDYIISYLARWVVPPWLLERAGIAAINFHPGPPDYPGIGCINFALYDDVLEYGATCHFMAPKVDTGPIIAVRRVPVLAGDDVASLLSRTCAAQLALFMEIAGQMALGQELVPCEELWSRPPYTRKEFDELATLRRDMSVEEIARRRRATTFGRWSPRWKWDVA